MPTIPAFQVLIDWENTGTFAGTHDDVTDDVQNLTWFSGFRTPFQAVCDEPECEIVLKNVDGKYLPEGGPLDGKIVPQRLVQIKQGATVFWQGWIDYPDVEWSAGNILPPVRILCRGAIEILRDADITLGLYTSVKPNEIVEDALAEVFDTALDYSDITGTAPEMTTVNEYGDNSQSALSAISDMMILERGRFFFNRENAPQILSRGDQTRIGMGVDGGTTYTINTQTENKPSELEYEYGQSVVTAVRVESRPRRVATSETLWELDAPISIAPGATITFLARLRRDTGQFVAVTGTLTAIASFSSGTGIVTATASGAVAFVEVENIGITSAVLASLQLTGTPQWQQNNLTVEAEDAAAIAIYGRRVMSIDVAPGTSYSDARNIAEYELDRWRKVRASVRSMTWRIPGPALATWALREMQAVRRCQIIAPEMNHDAMYMCIGEEWKAVPGRELQVTRYFEPADVQEYWILGVSRLGVDTRLAY